MERLLRNLFTRANEVVYYAYNLDCDLNRDFVRTLKRLEKQLDKVVELLGKETRERKLKRAIKDLIILSNQIISKTYNLEYEISLSRENREFSKSIELLEKEINYVVESIF